MFKNLNDKCKNKILYGENIEKCKIDTLQGKTIVQKGIMVPRAMESAACEYLKNLEVRGIIRKSTSNWRNPVRFIEKPDGKLRLVMNLMKLNDLTVKDNYKLSTIREIICETHNSCIFSVIDCKKAFYSVEIEENDKHKTAFEFKNQCYEWNSMVMGFKNSPMILQRIMDKMFSDLLGNGVRVYLDDIIIYAKNKEQHDKLIVEVCKRMINNKFVINCDKIQFAQNKVKVLGVEIDGNDIIPLEEHKKKIIEFEKPKNIKETRQFLGTANYIRQYIENYSDMTFHLSSSLRVKDTKDWRWTEKMNIEFESLKEAIRNIESIKIANYDKDFILRTDASNIGLGAVLMQKNEKNAYDIIEYASKKLTDVQRKYGITEKELLAVLFGMENSEYELKGKTFTLEIDHKAIKVIRNKVDFGNDRMKRWIEKISEFDFTIKYVKGENMGIADKLSRNKMISEKRADAIRLGKEKKHIKTNDNIKYWQFDNNEIRIIPEDEDKEELITKKHIELKHRSVECVYYDLRKKYYWFGMKKQIEKNLQKCEICQINNRKNKLQPKYVITNEPFEKIALDIMETKKRYILVGIDYYTRIMQAKVMKNKTSEEVCLTLKEWFKKGCLPKEIITDNGREFDNCNFKEMLERYGIIHRKTSVESHRSNGRIERSIDTLREYVAKMGIDNIESKTDEYIRAYNNTYHTNIKRTPNEALNNYTDLELQELNQNNKNMKNRINSRSSKNLIKEGDLVRVCQKENIGKELRGRYTRFGKIIGTYPNDSVLVKMDDTGRMVKKNISDVKVYELTAGGGMSPPIMVFNKGYDS